MEILSKSERKLVYRKDKYIVTYFLDINLFYEYDFFYNHNFYNKFFPKKIYSDNMKRVIITEYIFDESDLISLNEKLFLIGSTIKEIHKFPLKYWKGLYDKYKIYFNNNFIYKSDVDIFLNIGDLKLENILYNSGKIYIVDLEIYTFGSKYTSLLDFFISNYNISKLLYSYFLKGYNDFYYPDFFRYFILFKKKGLKDPLLFNIKLDNSKYFNYRYKKIYMNKLEELFDDLKYKEVLNLANPYIKKNFSENDILYYLKSILVLDNFEIRNEIEIKKLLFYYFYLKKEVVFDNGYKFSFKDILKINFLNFENDIKNLEKFQQYFDLGKNKIFLLGRKGVNPYLKIVNILDFFVQFTFDCAELYSFQGEHHPFFKWLIRELVEDE